VAKAAKAVAVKAANVVAKAVVVRAAVKAAKAAVRAVEAKAAAKAVAVKAANVVVKAVVVRAAAKAVKAVVAKAVLVRAAVKALVARAAVKAAVKAVRKNKLTWKRGFELARALHGAGRALDHLFAAVSKTRRSPLKASKKAPFRREAAVEQPCLHEPRRRYLPCLPLRTFIKAPARSGHWTP
jgi:hypothetical protein